MTNNQQREATSGRYSYHRNRDGCDDVFLIEDADGHCILQLHFWDEPDTIEAVMAEAKAQMLVAGLNLTGGGWVLPPYPHWTLRQNKQIAAIWSVQDVQKDRPHLTEDQAWEVLQCVEHYHDCNYGITWDTLRLTADEMFPPKPARRPKRSK